MLLADLSMRYPLLRGKKPLLLASVIAVAMVLGIMAPSDPVLAIGAEILVLLAIGILAKPDIATMAVLAVLYTNADGVLNDDHYDYDTVALPFLADLAEVIARRTWNVPAP